MKLVNSLEIDIKKSRFIGYYYEIDNIEEVNAVLTSIKKENKKARHFPFAYKIDNNIRKSDDKEPSGTAGNPILNIIDQKKLNHTLIIIVRYFGGIKLGAGGLIRAYSSVANNVTNKNSL